MTEMTGITGIRGSPGITGRPGKFSQIWVCRDWVLYAELTYHYSCITSEDSSSDICNMCVNKPRMQQMMK